MTAAGKPTPPAVEAPRALLVEHDLSTRRVIRLALEALGFAVVDAPSGDEALEKLAAEVFAIAILESRLPGALAGVEVLESIKLQLPSLPVLVMGEPDRPRDLLDAFHAGAADVLLEPFEPAELRTALARALASKSAESAVDFHGRLELAKTALAQGAFDVAAAHLRSALGTNPVDAEAMNLYGVVLELRADVDTAVLAYRAAYAFDPDYGRARRNLDRTSEQPTYVGPVEPGSVDLFHAAQFRVGVPVFDPVKDLPLLRIAKAVTPPAGGVAIGHLLDPPTAEASAASTVARRRAFLRSMGRNDPAGLACVVHYLFARDRVLAARKLHDEERCTLAVIGRWAPRSVLDALVAAGLPVVVARESDWPPHDAIRVDTGGARGALRLALGVHLALRSRVPLALPDVVENLPARHLFERAGLTPPPGTELDRHVAVRSPAEGTPLLTIGATDDAFLWLP